MVTYCIDTSALIEAWQADYPIENFPGFWKHMENLINAGRLIAPEEVLRETTEALGRAARVAERASAMFRDLDEAVQIEAAEVLAQYPAPWSASASCAPRPIRSSSPWRASRAFRS